jgi:hypothetical protein
MKRLMAALQDKTLSDDSSSSSIQKKRYTAKPVCSSLWSAKLYAENVDLFVYIWKWSMFVCILD